MTPEQMAEIYARAFAGHGRAWFADEMATLLQDPHVFVVAASAGFAMGRVVVDEAELLTIATDPLHQRSGIARAVLQDFQAKAAQLGARMVFLEVARDNLRALGLYQAFGFQEVGCRLDYYRREDGTRSDALILEAEMV